MNDTYINTRVGVHACVHMFMIGCGVLATIGQWSPRGNFNEYNGGPSPTTEFFRKGTIERTMRYPTIIIREEVRVIWSILPLRKNLLGSKRKANNHYFVFMLVSNLQQLIFVFVYTCILILIKYGCIYRNFTKSVNGFMLDRMYTGRGYFYLFHSHRFKLRDKEWWIISLSVYVKTNLTSQAFGHVNLDLEFWLEEETAPARLSWGLRFEPRDQFLEYLWNIFPHIFSRMIPVNDVGSFYFCELMPLTNPENTIC